MNPAALVARILAPLARSLAEAGRHLDLEALPDADSGHEEAAPASVTDALIPARGPSSFHPLPASPAGGANALPQDPHPIALPPADLLPRAAPAVPSADAPSGASRPLTPLATPAPASPDALWRPASCPPGGPTRPAPAGVLPADRLAASSALPARRPSLTPTPTVASLPADLVAPPSAVPPAASVPSPDRLAAPAAGQPCPAPALPVAWPTTAADYFRLHALAPTTASPRVAAPAPAAAPDAPPPPPAARPGQTSVAPVQASSAAAPEGNTPPALTAPPPRWRLRPTPAAAATVNDAPDAAPAAVTTAPPPAPRHPVLHRVIRGLDPVFEQAWQHTDAVLQPPPARAPAEEPTDSPRVSNHFHVSVALAGDGAAAPEPQQLEEALVALLREAARRQGLDV